MRRGAGDGSRWKDPLTDPDIEAVVPVKEGEKARFFVLRSLNHDNLAASCCVVCVLLLPVSVFLFFRNVFVPPHLLFLSRTSCAPTGRWLMSSFQLQAPRYLAVYCIPGCDVVCVCFFVARKRSLCPGV